MDLNECLSFAEANIHNYPALHIHQNTVILPYDYKAITLLATTGVGNSEAKNSLSKIFPDYIPVPSTSPDFSRMTIFTRTWVVGIEAALIAAETATAYNTIPQKLRRVYRNGQMFISYSYDKVNYLVACSQNSYY
jgi:hypothetical protein